MTHMQTNEPEWYSDYIILSGKAEIASWCKTLNCSEANLIRAINIMGNSAKAVNSYLELNRLKENPAE
jgi:hypothetical protein